MNILENLVSNIMGGGKALGGGSHCKSNWGPFKNNEGMSLLRGPGSILNYESWKGGELEVERSERRDDMKRDSDVEGRSRGLERARVEGS